jgi:hypothetical protein
MDSFGCVSNHLPENLVAARFSVGIGTFPTPLLLGQRLPRFQWAGPSTALDDY